MAEIDKAELRRRLEGMLHSFEAMKAGAESSIFMIKQELEKLGKIDVPDNEKVDVGFNLDDPNVLGIDSIGRVIKRRRLSPETIEKKRALMKGIREQRLRDIEELKKLRAEKESREKAAPAIVGGAGKKK